MFKQFISWFKQRHDVERLAQSISAQALVLYDSEGMITSDIGPKSSDILEILQFADDLLEKIVSEQHHGDSESDSIQPGIEENGRQDEEPRAEALEKANGPTKTAKSLIRLRDWLLLAKTQKANNADDVFEVLYSELASILKQENIQALEFMGVYDQDTQQVLEARNTNDLNQDNQVAATIRPGYLFHGQLLRPQDVVIYRFQQQSQDVD